MRRFAAGGDLQRRDRSSSVVPDDIEVGDAEPGAGELCGDVDPELTQVGQELADQWIVDRIEIDDDTLVQCPEPDHVAVALQQFHDPVCDGVLEVEPGTETVGDRSNQARAGRQIGIVRRNPLVRDQHRLA